MSRLRNMVDSEEGTGTITAKRNQRIFENKQEHKKNSDYEERLADISKFSYSEVDYTQDLVRRPYEEKPVEVLDYLYVEVEIGIDKIFGPIIKKNLTCIAAVVFLMLFWGLLVSSKSVVYFPVLLLLLAVGMLFTTLLYQGKKLRNEKLALEIQKTKAVIEQRRATEQVKRDNMKLVFEKLEDERVAEIEALLNGNQGAILHHLSIVLPLINIPFLSAVDVNILDMLPLFKIYVPHRNVVPQQASVLQSNGKLVYEKKSVMTLNKQYLELCCAVCMRIITAIYENIPTFDKGYLNAVIKDDLGERCIMKAIFDRNGIKEACGKVNGIAAMQYLGAEYSLDEELYLLNIEEGYPPEWGDFVQRMIDTIHIKILK